MRRRDFAITIACCVVPGVGLRAQQSAMPVVGFLRSTPSAPFAHLLAAVREGLKEAGFVEGRNLAIEQRYADNHLDRLPALAADLVRRKVAVIVGNSLGAQAAKLATATIPIVFVSGEDPVVGGLVSHLGHPSGNVTGVTFFGGSQLVAKRIELLRDLVPNATVFAVLSDSSDPRHDAYLRDTMAAGRGTGRQIVAISAASERDFEDAFARIARSRASALLVSAGPRFNSRRHELVALAARHGIPAIYALREYVVAGGLISYVASQRGAYRQAGEYAAKILKGAKPSELPVLQPTKIELVVNLKTAKALGLTVPQSILVQADEVIE